MRRFPLSSICLFIKQMHRYSKNRTSGEEGEAGGRWCELVWHLHVSAIPGSNAARVQKQAGLRFGEGSPLARGTRQSAEGLALTPALPDPRAGLRPEGSGGVVRRQRQLCFSVGDHVSV